MTTGGKRPGEAYDTVCTVASPAIATCEGDGLTATAENDDGYFKVSNRYVWVVIPAVGFDPTGKPGSTQSGS